MNNNYYNPYAQAMCGPGEEPTISGTKITAENTEIMRSPCRRRMENPIPKDSVYAMAYVPFQHDIECYDCFRALKSGTLFPRLDKPFKGGCRYE